MLYVIEYGNHRVQKFTLDGQSLGLWGGEGLQPGRLHSPWALAVDSMGETRSAIRALREHTLPVADSLRLLAEHHAAEFAITGEAGEAGAEASHTIVRVAQEALTNAAKYAPGAQRVIGLAFSPDRVRLTVHNDPSIRPPRTDLAGGTGVGLVGMRERAARLDGTLHAAPADDGGWTVELDLPRKSAH